MATKLYIDLAGTLRVRGPGGAEYTPRSAKAGALIGILALTFEFRRSRRWIESKHWSDRSDQPARHSLRQTLSEIRKALGADRGAIEADRELVLLRPDRIHVDTVHGAAATRARAAAGRELLQGLSVRDEEFEDWRRAERATSWRRRSAWHTDPRGILQRPVWSLRGAGWLSGLRVISARPGHWFCRRVLNSSAAVSGPVWTSGPCHGTLCGLRCRHRDKRRRLWPGRGAQGPLSTRRTPVRRMSPFQPEQRFDASLMGVSRRFHDRCLA